MASGTPKSKSRSNQANQSKGTKFEMYWPMEKVKAGLQSGEVIEGCIRVNPKNFEESFVLHPKGDADVLLVGLGARNRALNDDSVAVLIEPIREWHLSAQSSDQPKGNGDKKSGHFTVGMAVRQDPTRLASLFPNASAPVDLESNLDPAGCAQLFNHVVRTGRVVSVLKPMHHRTAVGTVKPMAAPEKNPAKRMLFHPVDRRIPRMILNRDDYPPNILVRVEEFATSYFMAKVVDWPVDSVYAKGRIVRLLGEAGDLSVERQSLLITHGIAEKEFSPEVLACIGQPAVDGVEDEEIKRRRDLRGECVFTIDPPTARDLDDALHVKDLGGGRFEVGVHIADVSFYVKENNALDAEARTRGTTVYLVEEVVPMLPRRLCEELCSLNPGEPKLTFSAIWEMDDEGNILNTWLGRTVIQSCAKLSYQHAQDYMSERDRTQWPDERRPQVFPPFSLSDVIRSVHRLADITVHMRSRRFENGALALNTAKLGFVFDADKGVPCGVQREMPLASCHLVEELMLLANITVAEKLFEGLPDEAFLRRHPAPSERALKEVQEVFRALNMEVNTDSSSAIHESLQRWTADIGDNQTQVLVNLLSKPMQLARYFCAGQLARADRNTSQDFTRHYALNVPLYTHFTSPIRRYPDIIVHRQLAAILEGRTTSIVDSETPQPSLDAVGDWCNWRKKNAKLASEASRDLYLRAFICSIGSMQENGMVLGVLDRSFDVLLISLGIIKRVYIDQIEGLQAQEFFPLAEVKAAGRLTLYFKDNFVQIVKPMSSVKLLLKKSAKENEMKFDVLLTPTPRKRAEDG